MAGSSRIARKALTNLSIRIDLVRRAKALGVDLSELVNHALERAILDAERTAWLEQNRGAIEAYNARIAADGTFGDDWRRF